MLYFLSCFLKISAIQIFKILKLFQTAITYMVVSKRNMIFIITVKKNVQRISVVNLISSTVEALNIF